MAEGGYAAALAEARGPECAGLCDSCLGRAFARRLGLRSARRLGARLRSGSPAKGCGVCGGLMDALGEIARSAAEAMAGAQYSTFSVGAVLRPSVAERDDALRARLRARGAESIKSEVTRELGRRIARATGKVQDRADPDLSVVVDFAGRCSVRAKEVIVSGRYTKSARGLPQRAGAGGPSVESLIAGHLSDIYGCTQVRTGWSGSEDRDSLVGGAGRPFFARAVNPRRRFARLPKTAVLGPVRLECLRRVRAAPPPSRIVCVVRIRARTEAKDLKALRSLVGAVSVSEGRRRAERTVHSVRFRRGKGGAFAMKVTSDGGIPIKKLVEGGGVEPSAASVLGAACECVGFDFEDIRAR